MTESRIRGFPRIRVTDSAKSCAARGPPIAATIDHVTGRYVLSERWSADAPNIGCAVAFVEGGAGAELVPKCGSPMTLPSTVSSFIAVRAIARSASRAVFVMFATSES